MDPVGKPVWRKATARFLGIMLLSMTTGAALKTAAAEDGNCGTVGNWVRPGMGEVVPVNRLIGTVAERPVVLLGETHDNAEHHRWQLYTMAALYGRNPNMVLGFESFPRRLQPTLDRWVSGELDVETFVDGVEWEEVWGYEADLYMPLFHFARQNRIPMVALNVDRALVSRVGQEGWAAVPAGEREGLSDPAPADTAYRESLARIYLLKQSLGSGGEPAADIDESEIEAILETESFGRFVEAQLTWDRAMAEALAKARRARPEALVVGVMGQGHVEYGYGVPHQLADLEIPDAAVLLPVEPMADCAALLEGFADAVFIVAPEQRIEKAKPRPRLGVLVETAEEGVTIAEVADDSVAAAAGLRTGDIVVSAAGFSVAQAAELVEIVQRQAPGTWLPLVVRRDGERVDVLAKFPTSFGGSQ